MDTTIKWNASASRQVAAITRPKWEQIRQGLMLVVIGHAVFFGLGLPGLLFLGPEGKSVAGRIGLVPEDSLLVGLTLLFPGVLVGYGLILAGQWRCLSYAPQGNGAKELLFSCLLCTITAPFFPLIGYFLGGKKSYAVLLGGPSGFPELDIFTAPGILLVAGLVIVLTSVFFFSAFARAVERYLGDISRARGVVLYFFFVLFLLGGTVGLFLHSRNTAPPRVWLGLTIGWLLCLLWHTLLIHGAGQTVARMLRQKRSRLLPVVQETVIEVGQVALRSMAYLNRDVG